MYQSLLLVCCANPEGLTGGPVHLLLLSSSDSCRFSQRFLHSCLIGDNKDWRYNVQTATRSRMQWKLMTHIVDDWHFGYPMSTTLIRLMGLADWALGNKIFHFGVHEWPVQDFSGTTETSFDSNVFFFCILIIFISFQKIHAMFKLQHYYTLYKKKIIIIIIITVK